MEGVKAESFGDASETLKLHHCTQHQDHSEEKAGWDDMKVLRMKSTPTHIGTPEIK